MARSMTAIDRTSRTTALSAGCQVGEASTQVREDHWYSSHQAALLLRHALVRRAMLPSARPWDDDDDDVLSKA